LRQIYQKWFEK